MSQPVTLEQALSALQRLTADCEGIIKTCKREGFMPDCFKMQSLEDAREILGERLPQRPKKPRLTLVRR